MLKHFEAFDTADEKGASSLNKTKAVPVVLFKQLGQVNPEYFSQHAEKVKKKQISLRYLIEKNAVLGCVGRVGGGPETRS